jgi:hypothetical protein
LVIEIHLLNVKEISNLENKKAKKIESLQNKIAEVKSELENKNDYKSVIEKIKLQDEKIKAIQDGIIVKPQDCYLIVYKNY